MGTIRSLGEGGYASAFAVRSRLRPTKVGGFRPTKLVERCHGCKAVGLHKRKTGGGKIPLRFSKSGERNIEEAYARHFVRLGKAAAVNALSAEHVIDARAKSEL